MPQLGPACCHRGGAGGYCGCCGSGGRCYVFCAVEEGVAGAGALLGPQYPFGGEGLFGLVQAPLYLPELCCYLQLCGVRRGLPIAVSAHPSGTVEDALLVWGRLPGVECLRLELLLASCFLTSSVLHLLECNVVWGRPHVMREILYGYRGNWWRQ